MIIRMKRNIYLFLAAVLFMGTSADAQMGAAQKMTFDSDTVVVFSAPLQKVWKLVKDPAKWNELSNGYVAGIEGSGDLQSGWERKITFADGRHRTDEVTQYQPEYNFIVSKVKSPLPKGIQDNIYMLSLQGAPGGGTQMKYSIKVDGEEPGKQQLLEALKKEMEVFIRGVGEALDKEKN